MNVDILPKAGPRSKPLTYRWPESLGEPEVGMRVKVPLRSLVQEGWIVKVGEEVSKFNLKPVRSKIGPGPPANLVDLCFALAELYRVSPSYFLQMASPKDHVYKEFRYNREPPYVMRYGHEGGSDPFQLLETSKQPVLYWTPADGSLIDVLKERIDHYLFEGGSVVVIVPNYLRVREVEKALDRRGYVLHLYDSDWLDIASCATKQVVVGPRSAVMAPVADLGAIVVVDPLDRSMREQRTPFYELWEIAKYRAQFENLELEVVTTMPPISVLQSVKVMKAPKVAMAKGFGRVYLHNSFDFASYLEVVPKVFDLADRQRQDLSSDLDATLIVVFNKKGFILRVSCKSCREVQTCESCGSPLVGVTAGPHVGVENTSRVTLAKERAKLTGLYCSSCDTAYPPVCGQCRSFELKSVSKGTQKVSQELQAILGDKVTVTEFESLEGEDFKTRFDVLVATESILLGSLKASSVLFLDFDQLIYPSSEGSTYLMYLLSRASSVVQGSKGSIHLQGRHMDSELVQDLHKGKTVEYIKGLFKERESFGLPPFSDAAKLDQGSAKRFQSYIDVTLKSGVDLGVFVGDVDDQEVYVSASSRRDLLHAVRSFEQDCRCKIKRLELAPRGVGFL